MQTLFTISIALQFVAVAAHDLVDVPGWTHGSQVRMVLGARKLWLATAINSLFPATAAAFALWFWGRPKPAYVVNYWVVYSAVTLASAIWMWYVPYFFGGREEQKREYRRMYAGTRHVLPPRGDNLRPNLLHVCFHALFVVNFALAVLM